MKSIRLQRILAFVFVYVMVVPLLLSKVEVKAVTNEFDKAEELYLDTKITAYQDGEDVYWYKFDMKKVTDRKNIKIILMGQSDFNEDMTLDIYNASGQPIEDYYYPCASANRSVTWEYNIADSSNDPDNFAKGEIYYFKVYGGNGRCGGHYTLLVTGDKATKSGKLTVSVKKGKKSISINTIEDANVTVSINNKIIKKENKKVKKIKLSSGSGTVKVHLSRKLKKGDKITVTVKKSGFETKKITKKIK